MHKQLQLVLSFGTTSLIAIAGACAADANGPYQAGVRAYGQGDYKQADTDFEQAVKMAPADVNALYYEALCKQRLRQWTAAKACYKGVILLSPNSAVAESARKVLKALEPQSSVQEPTDASSSPGIADADDMRDLPDKASFYFTKTDSGHMQVKLLLNGSPVTALFDTGASAFFYRDQLTDSGVDTSKAIAGGTTHGWAGKAVPISRMPATIKLGTLTRTIQIKLEDTTSGFGNNLIGQTLVQGYHYSIDDKAGRVDLIKGSLASERSVDSLYDVPCVKRNGHDYVQIQLNGKTIEAFIDTGSDASVIDNATAQSVGLDLTGESIPRRGVGGSWTANAAYAKVRLGPVIKDNFRVLVGGEMGNCIGQDFMQGWRCVVDRDHNLLRFFH